MKERKLVKEYRLSKQKNPLKTILLNTSAKEKIQNVSRKWP